MRDAPEDVEPAIDDVTFLRFINIVESSSGTNIRINMMLAAEEALCRRHLGFDGTRSSCPRGLV